MRYKGHELKEITEPQIFDPPKKMVVWNYDKGRPVDVRELPVIAILPRLRTHANIVCRDGGLDWWATACAEIPEEPKPRMATNRELSKWLAQGNGEAKDCINNVITYCIYRDGKDEIPDSIMVRNWDDTEWHEPTAEYLGLEA